MKTIEILNLITEYYVEVTKNYRQGFEDFPESTKVAEFIGGLTGIKTEKIIRTYLPQVISDESSLKVLNANGLEISAEQIRPSFQSIQNRNRTLTQIENYKDGYRRELK